MVATEERLVDYFLFRIGLVPQGNSENGLPFVFAETDGFRIRSSMGFDVILGMDVLRQCDFGMRRTGDWQLSFG